MKKCISMLLALLMMLTIIPTAFADSSYSQPCVVDYFNSFNGFEKQAGTYDVPDGLKPFLYSNSWAKRLSSESDGVNDYLKFSDSDQNGSSTALMLPFDETIRTGKLHMSFDLKIEDYTKLYRFYVYAHDNRENDNPLDLTYDVTDKDGNPVIDDKTGKQKIEYSYTQLFDMGITDKTYQKLSLRGDRNKQIDIAGNIKNEWHKYDLEIDFTEPPYKIVLAIDGRIRTESTLPYGLKSLYFFYTPGSGDNAGRNTPIYMDNLFVKHYPNGTYSSTEMKVDYAGSAIANKNVSVDVSFSEASGVINDGGDPVESEFVARNVVDNTETEPITAVKKEPNIRLTFDNLATGTYRIICKNPSAYQGLFTNEQPSYSDTFSTAGTAQNVKEQNILVEDDFENYTGGIPANAEGLGGSKSHWTDKIHAATGNGGGTALEIKEQQVIYQFPYALTGDRFSYEFDIKHTDGRWFTGILTEDTLSGKQSIHKDLYKNAIINQKEDLTQEKINTSVGNYKAETNAIGCISYTEDPKDGAVGPEAVQYATARLSWLNAKVQDLTCEKNKWNHVKVDVDLGASTYTITINGVSKTVALNRDRFRPVERYMKKTVNGEEKWVRTWDYGIKGISLGCYGGKTETNKGVTGSSDPTVYYDNFKVYNDNSYNAYQDFNAATRADNNSGITQGWIMQSYPNDSWQALVGSEGRYYSAESNSDDKAVKLTKLHAVPYSYQFNRPVAANTPFEMDFDIKGDATNNKNELNFRLLTKDQLYSMYENTPNSGKAAESIINASLDDSNAREMGICTNDAKYYNSSVIFSARTEDSGDHKTSMRITKDNGTHTWTSASSTWLDNEGKEIPIDIDNKWAHVKLSGYPKGGKMAFVLSVTDESGNTKTSQEFVSAISADTEFAAFGIATAKQYANLNTQITYLDNFTVKEVNPVSNAYVTAVKAVDMVNGETADLTSGLKAKGQNIEISFSEAVAEDTISNIKIYQGNPVKFINTTAVLSDDKKTVTLTPQSIPTVGEKYMLEIPCTVKTAAASNLSGLKPKAVAFEIKDADAAELKVEDFRLYKYYEAGKNDTVEFAENWVPVADDELKDLTADDKFRFIAKGYNTGDATPIWLGRAEKDPTTALLTNFDNQTATANYGKFEVALPEFTMETANGSLETYLWESTGLRPLCGKYVFSVTKTPTEATE